MFELFNQDEARQVDEQAEIGFRGRWLLVNFLLTSIKCKTQETARLVCRCHEVDILPPPAWGGSPVVENLRKSMYSACLGLVSLLARLPDISVEKGPISTRVTCRENRQAGLDSRETGEGLSVTTNVTLGESFAAGSLDFIISKGNKETVTVFRLCL